MSVRTIVRSVPLAEVTDPETIAIIARVRFLTQLFPDQTVDIEMTPAIHSYED